MNFQFSCKFSFLVKELAKRTMESRKYGEHSMVVSNKWYKSLLCMEIKTCSDFMEIVLCLERLWPNKAVRLRLNTSKWL